MCQWTHPWCTAHLRTLISRTSMDVIWRFDSTKNCPLCESVWAEQKRRITASNRLNSERYCRLSLLDVPARISLIDAPYIRAEMLVRSSGELHRAHMTACSTTDRIAFESCVVPESRKLNAHRQVFWQTCEQSEDKGRWQQRVLRGNPYILRRLIPPTQMSSVLHLSCS